jgi:hypothetical protein
MTEPTPPSAELSVADVAATIASRLGGQEEAAVEKEVAVETDGEEETKPDGVPNEETDGDADASEDESEEDESDADEEGEEEETDSKAWPESANKRVGKLTAQKAKLVEEKEGLSAKVVELEKALQESLAIKPVADGKSPLANITSREGLEAEKKEATEALEWLEANEDGGEVGDGKGGTIYLDAKAVAAQKKQIQKVLSTHIPERESWLKAQAEASADAEKTYPELFKPSKDSDRAFALLKQYPALNNYPDRVRLIGDMLIGEAYRSGEFVLVPKNKAVAPKKQAPKAPNAGAKPIPSKDRKAPEVIQSRFLQSGTVDDAKSIIESRWK